MRRSLAFLGSILGLALASSAPAVAAQDAQLPGLEITALRFSGAGCPLTDELATVATNISDDRLAFTGTFSRMLAEASGTAGAATACDVEIDFVAPDGVVAELRSVHFRGYSKPGETRTAELRASYSLDGEKPRVFKHDLAQLGSEDFTLSYRVPVLVGQVCGGTHTLRLHMELTLSAASADETALLVLDSIDSDRILTHGFPIDTCATN